MLWFLKSSKMSAAWLLHKKQCFICTTRLCSVVSFCTVAETYYYVWNIPFFRHYPWKTNVWYLWYTHTELHWCHPLPKENLMHVRIPPIYVLLWDESDVDHHHHHHQMCLNVANDLIAHIPSPSSLYPHFVSFGGGGGDNKQVKCTTNKTWPSKAHQGRSWVLPISQSEETSAQHTVLLDPSPCFCAT